MKDEPTSTCSSQPCLVSHIVFFSHLCFKRKSKYIYTCRLSSMVLSQGVNTKSWTTPHGQLLLKWHSTLRLAGAALQMCNSLNCLKISYRMQSGSQLIKLHLHEKPLSLNVRLVWMTCSRQTLGSSYRSCHFPNGQRWVEITSYPRPSVPR